MYINAMSHKCRNILETEYVDNNHNFVSLEVIITVVFGVIVLLSVVIAVAV